MALAIEVSGVSKTFRRYHPERPRTFQEVLARGVSRIRAADRFSGLRDVSFVVPAGRTVGIIGANGSGKSTLLRLVAGVGRVDTGTIAVHGRVGALLDLGSGFHPDLTGRENAIVAGVLSGLTRREVLQRLDAIVAFAEVERFIDNPVRTYSTGMQMRLAFATAVHTDPDVLLIDEVLSVGDSAFQRKCLERIRAFKAQGCSILLVSHESSVVEELCDEALWLKAGQLMAYAGAREVVSRYLQSIGAQPPPAPEPATEPDIVVEPEPDAAPAIDPDPPPQPEPTPALVRTDHGAGLTVDEQRFGSVELRLSSLRMVHSSGEPVAELRAGQPLLIEIAFMAHEKIVAPIFHVRLIREDGVTCCDFNTEQSALSLSSLEGHGTLKLHLERLDLNSGRYALHVSAFAQDWAYAYDARVGEEPLRVIGDNLPGVMCLPHRWEPPA